MGFWETFWATMWGALGGAVVAAFVSWLFALELRRREDRGAYRRRLGEHLVKLVVLIGELEPLLFYGSRGLSDKRREVLLAIRAAMMDANDPDQTVLLMTRDAIEVQQVGDGASGASLVASIVAEWWQGTRDEKLERLTDKHQAAVKDLAHLVFDRSGNRRPRAT